MTDAREATREQRDGDVGFGAIDQLLHVEPLTDLERDLLPHEQVRALRQLDDMAARSDRGSTGQLGALFAIYPERKAIEAPRIREGRVLSLRAE